MLTEYIIKEKKNNNMHKNKWMLVEKTSFFDASVAILCLWTVRLVNEYFWVKKTLNKLKILKQHAEK